MSSRSSVSLISHCSQVKNVLGLLGKNLNSAEIFNETNWKMRQLMIMRNCFYSGLDCRFYQLVSTRVISKNDWGLRS